MKHALLAAVLAASASWTHAASADPRGEAPDRPPADRPAAAAPDRSVPDGTVLAVLRAIAAQGVASERVSVSRRDDHDVVLSIPVRR